MKNKVSVAIATFNGEKYIQKQLKSILNNIGNQDEIIVSDDGSQDNTISIIEEMQDPRIKIIEGPKQGVIKNFENAITYCTGDFIFLCDQDDIWKENKVKKVLWEFSQHKDVTLIMHDAEIIDEFDNVIGKSFFNFRKCKTGFLNNLVKNSYIGCCIAFKRELKEIILPLPPANEIPMHDQWIGMLNEIYGVSLFINQKLISYRRHSENVSNFKRNSLFIMIKKRIKLLKQIKKRKKEKHLRKKSTLKRKILHYGFRILIYLNYINCLFLKKKIINKKGIIEIKNLGKLNYSSGGRTFYGKDKLHKRHVIKVKDIYHTHTNENKIYSVLEKYNIAPKVLWYEENLGISIEFKEGETLDKYIKNNPIDKNFFEELKLFAINSLSIMEQEKIIHRDIKPENIIICNENQKYKFYLIDFGFSILNFKDSLSKEKAIDRRILNHLGEIYYSKPCIWDDADAFLNLLETLSFYLDIKIDLTEIKEKIGQNTYNISGGNI